MTPDERIAEIRGKAWNSLTPGTSYYMTEYVLDDMVWLIDQWFALRAVAYAARRIPDQVDWFSEDAVYCKACETYSPTDSDNGRWLWPETIDHGPDCPWLALQAALGRLEEVTG